MIFKKILLVFMLTLSYKFFACGLPVSPMSEILSKLNPEELPFLNIWEKRIERRVSLQIKQMFEQAKPKRIFTCFYTMYKNSEQVGVLGALEKICAQIYMIEAMQKMSEKEQIKKIELFEAITGSGLNDSVAAAAAADTVITLPTDRALKD